MQLNLLLIHLGAERLQLRLGGVEGRARLVEILLADDSGVRKAADAVVILLCPFHLGNLGGGCALLAFQRRLLLGRIDLHHRSASGDAFAGVDEDLGNDAFDLRHDHRGVAGFQGGDVFRGVVNLLRGCRLDFDRHGLRGGRLGFFTIAASGGEKERARQNHKGRLFENSRHIWSLSMRLLSAKKSIRILGLLLRYIGTRY